MNQAGSSDSTSEMPPNKKLGGIMEENSDSSNSSSKCSIADPPATQVALAMDHILELIFSYVDTRSLKDCRLTCHRWQYFGATEIQKRVSIVIFYQRSIPNGICPTEEVGQNQPNDNNQGNNADNPNNGSIVENPRNYGDEDDHIHVNTVAGIRRMLVPNPKQSLASLLTIMENSSIFPCSAFEIRNMKLRFNKIEEFLSTCGSQIQKLVLSLNYEDEGETGAEFLTDTSILTDFENVFSNFAPNIEILDLRMRLPSEWENPQDLLSALHILEDTFLPNLKSFTIRGTLLKVVFNGIMDAARNLQNYVAYGDFCLMEKYFVEENGRQRVGLLKHLDFFMNEEGIEILEKLVQVHGERMELESLRIMSLHTFFYDPALWERVRKVVEELLRVCAGTLKKMTFHPLKFLRELRIPRMDKLKALTLYDVDSTRLTNNFNVETEAEKYCSSGFSLETLFPAVETIEFEFYIDIEGRSNVKDLMDITLPVKSVTKVSVWHPDGVLEESRQVLMKTFPNALIS